MSTRIISAFLMVLPIGVMAMAQKGASRHPERLPNEVRKLVERYESCMHFAGEFNGDGSSRDRELNATMVELRCDKVGTDTAALRVKYARHPDALKALDAIEGL